MAKTAGRLALPILITSVLHFLPMLWEGGDISPRRRCGIDANQYTLFKRGMFAHGPTRTSRGVRAYVARWVKADVAEGQEHQAATWSVGKMAAGFIYGDRDGQKLAYVYFEEEPGAAFGGETVNAR
jgi:hypothetical protein